MLHILSRGAIDYLGGRIGEEGPEEEVNCEVVKEIK